MALTGIDVSRHQGTVDYKAVARAGHSFAFIKATDGIRYNFIGWFHDNAPKVRAAGLVLGAYHFLLDHHPGAAQARYYVDEVRKAGGFDGVVPIVDIEREADGTTPREEHLRAFVTEFRRLVPQRPILIYTGRWYWVGVLGNPPGSDLGPLWHSEYDGQTPIDEDVANGPELDNYGGWRQALVWQHTSTGSCPGVSGSCDLNLFYGTVAALHALAGHPTPTPPQEDDVAYYTIYTGPGMATRLSVDGAIVTAPAGELAEMITAYKKAGYTEKRVAFAEADDYARFVHGHPTQGIANTHPDVPA